MPRIRPSSVVISLVVASVLCPWDRAAVASDVAPTTFQRAISSWMGVVSLLADDGEADRGRDSEDHRDRGDRGGREGRGPRGWSRDGGRPAAEARAEARREQPVADHECKGEHCEHCKAKRQTAEHGKDHECTGAGCEHCRQHGESRSRVEMRGGWSGTWGFGPGSGRRPGGHASGGPGRTPHMGMPPMGPGMHPAPMSFGRSDSHARLDEIVERLSRIERKLDAAPRMGNPWSPRPEAGPTAGRGREMPEAMRREIEQRREEMRKRMEEARARAGDAGRERPQATMPAEMQERIKGMMDEGRKRMAEAHEKMEQARRRFQEMEERIKKLEAEVERLKAGK